MTINERIVKIAENEVGVTESPKGSNACKYNDWYYGRHVSGSPYEWCMAFVQWVYNSAGVKLPYKSASCSSTLNWWSKNKPECVVDAKSGVPGNIIILNGHTGIITGEFDGTGYATVEGNCPVSVVQSYRKASAIKKIIRIKEYEVEDMTVAELEKYLNDNAVKIAKNLLASLNNLPCDPYAVESSKKAVKSGAFGDNNKDDLIDSPQRPLTRQEFVAVLDRLKLI